MQTLTSDAELEEFLARKDARWLLKHSNACPVSFAAYDEVQAYEGAHGDIPVAVIVIQEQRPLSNSVAKRLGYTHQSPQLFLLDSEGGVTWQASHWGITKSAMEAQAAT